LEMAALLDRLPLVAGAFRAGRLSEVQAKEIVDAAAEVPDTQQQLVDAAEKLSLGDLRGECRRVKASVITDEAVPRCEMRRGLEIDHRDAWSATRDTAWRTWPGFVGGITTKRATSATAIAADPAPGNGSLPTRRSALRGSPPDRPYRCSRLSARRDCRTPVQIASTRR
jgi:hypothetical protein